MGLRTPSETTSIQRRLNVGTSLLRLAARDVLYSVGTVGELRVHIAVRHSTVREL